MMFIGIDPGLDGAVACTTMDAAGLHYTQVFDAPTFNVHGGKKTRREYDLQGMLDILRVACTGPVFVCIEKVHSMPEQGVASSFNFGRGFGLWEGLVVGLGYPYCLVTPQRWKKTFLDGMGHGKGASILVAKRLFPTVELSRVKHHGRADALLLAEFGRRTHGLKHDEECVVRETASR